MFAGPIISMINCGIEIWNFIVTNVVLPLLKGNPQSFNSAAYALIERVNVIFVGVGSTLVVLFFLIGFCANSIDIKEELRFEKVLQLFIKLSIAEYFVVNSLTIVEALFGSISGLVNLVAGNAGNIATLSLNSAMKDTIRDSGFGWQLLLIPVAFVFFLALVAASLLIVYQAYSRFLKVLIAAPYGALPIGVRQIDHLRSMLTPSLAAFVPFRVMELSKKGQVTYYGINQVSLQVILGNRKLLFNGNGFYLGIPGSGKSFDAKLEQACVLCGSADDVIIVDPTLEYLDLAEPFNGSVVNFATYTKNYINPLDFDLSIIGNTKEFENMIRNKSQLMLSICRFNMDNFDGKHKSIVDRAVRIMYRRIAELPEIQRYIPIMSDFSKELYAIGTKEAEDVALSLEILVDGSLNIFNHQTNVDINNRLVVYGIRDLGRELFPTAMLIMLEHIDARISKNAKLKKATWLYIDEIHELIGNEFSAEYLEKCWKKHRKLGGIDTGLTQNISDMMNSKTAKTMINNSEFFMILKQSPDDVEDILDCVKGISQELVKYIIHAQPGTGIIKHGDVILPFDNRIEKTSPMYKIFNTNLHEKAANQKTETTMKEVI